MADHHDPAENGSTVTIGKIGTHGGGNLGAFHRRGQDPTACIICVQTGTKLTLSGITPQLRRKFDLGETAVATFVETPNWHDDDRLTFDNGKDVPLLAFAGKGVTAFVGIKQEAAPDPVNRVEAGPALKSHTGVLETHHDEARAVA